MPKAEVSAAIFWKKFAKNNWEKRPGVFKDTGLPIFEMDAAHIFALLLRYSDRCRKSQSAPGLKFYIDGQRQFESTVLESLPEKKDKSLVGYHKRMSEMYDDYCLVCDELLQVTHEKWSVLSGFVEGLYREVGLPNRFAEIGLYLGNYRKTPFGVHVDGCGVLSIPVVGKKKFRLWTPEFLKRNPDLAEAHTYTEFKKGSSVMTAVPGEIAYWPSPYWHIAESDGSFSATWSIGIWVDEPYSETLSRTLKPLVAKRLGKIASARSIHQGESELGEVTELPLELSESVEALKNLSESELRDSMLRFWLAHSSKQGFKNGPSVLKKKTLRPKDRVRLSPGQSLKWTRLASGNVLIGASGQTIEVAGSNDATSDLRALNSGRALAVAQLKKWIALDDLQLLLDTGSIDSALKV